jgi:hypothetical protein
MLCTARTRYRTEELLRTRDDRSTKQGSHRVTGVCLSVLSEKEKFPRRLVRDNQLREISMAS